MDIRDQLQFEFSKSNADRIVQFIGENKESIDELIRIFLSNDQKISLRASMVLARIMDKHSYLMTPYIASFVECYLNHETKIAIVRIIARFFQTYTLPEKYQAAVLDRSYELLINNDNSIAVRAFSMGTIENISRGYKELLKEFIIVLEDLYTEGSTGLENKRIKTLNYYKKSHS